MAELKRHLKNPSTEIPKRDITERPENTKKRCASKDDLSLLNLLIQHPDTIPRLMEFDCKILLSDPEVVGIVDIIFEKHINEGSFSPEDLLDSLPSEPSQERLREVLHKPFIVYSDQAAEQAVTEFEKRVHQKKISASFKKARGDTGPVQVLTGKLGVCPKT